MLRLEINGFQARCRDLDGSSVMNERWYAGLGGLMIALAAFHVYLPQLGFYFTDVDTFMLIATSKFGTFDEFVSMLGSPMMGGQLSNALFYRPISSMTWAFDHTIWGTAPFGYHLTDLLIHTATSLVFFSLLLGLAKRAEPSFRDTRRRISQGRVEALVAALLFAIHPIAMETVPAIARRPDLLFGLFLQLTLFSLHRHLSGSKRLGLACASLFCVLGVASKDSAIAILPIAMAFVFCFSAAQTGRARIFDCVRVAAPMLLALVLYVATRIWILGGVGGYVGAQEYSIGSVFKTSVGTFLCVAVAPGNLDRCTPSSLPLLGIGLSLLAATSLFRLWPIRTEAVARRVVFGALAVGAFLMLYLVVRTPALTRTIYAMLPFVCIVIGWGGVDGVRGLARFWSRRSEVMEIDEGGPGIRIARSAARVVSGSLFALVVASIVHGGMTRVYLDEWREMGATMKQTLAAAAPHVERLAEGSVVYLINFPHKVNNPRPMLRDHPLFEDHSVQGWAELVYPEKRLDVIGLSDITFHMREPRDIAYLVRFDRDTMRVEVVLGSGGSAESFPTDRPYGKRHPLREISNVEDESGSRLVIELTPDALAADEVAFLVYLGDRVVMRRADASWSVAAEPSG